MRQRDENVDAIADGTRFPARRCDRVEVAHVTGAVAGDRHPHHSDAKRLRSPAPVGDAENEMCGHAIEGCTERIPHVARYPLKSGLAQAVLECRSREIEFVVAEGRHVQPHRVEHRYHLSPVELAAVVRGGAESGGTEQISR